MNRQTFFTAISSMCALSSLLSPTFAAESVHRTAEQEINRRNDYRIRGLQMLEKGDVAMAARDYATAVSEYKGACDFIPNSEMTQISYDRALKSFCEASCRLAEQRISEGRYADAQKTVDLVVSERYNPRCKEAVLIRARLEDPEYYNRTIGPVFRGNVEKVKQLFIDAKGFYDTDRFDLAFKRCEQILAIDPYNKAAKSMEEKISRAKSDFNIVSYNEARGRAIQKVDQAWGNPVRRFNANVAIGVIEQSSKDPGNMVKIQQKLDRIIIPKLDFKEATIREAVDFLKRKSIELDPSDPKTGINIVLKLDPGAGGGAPDPGLPAPVIPGAGGIPGIDPAPPLPPPIAPSPTGGGAADTRITVALSNIPLSEALKYVTGLANLKYKVEPFAVSIVPASTNTDVMITKEWKVRADLIPRTQAGGGGGGGLGAPAAPAFGGGGGAGGGDASRGGSGIADRESAKNWLIAEGVTFNGQASAIYLVSNSRLIVRNTQDQLDLVDTIINAPGDSGGPRQVEIEAKFVEISQNNTKELSFDWLVGAFNATKTDRVFASGGTAGNAEQVNPANYPFVPPGTNPVPVGTNPVTAGNRSGSLALSGSAVDALLFGTPLGAGRVAPGIAALSGVFTDPQFQVVIRALNQKKGIDLLSAPRVTTKSGQRAVIEVIREFKYPTEFSAPQIPQTIAPQQQNINPLNPFVAQQAQSFPVTPTTPTAFEVRNVGVTLEVDPTINPDGLTIDLNLVPQVVEFEGFINYGSPIQTQTTNPITGTQTTNVLTPNTINQPIFSTRKVTTTVAVYDGNTVVLGGLMREDVQKIEDKVPFLGDIPLVGRLFRSSVDQHTKRNLVIFVSARIMKPDGEPVRNEEEVEEVIEPLGLPDAGFAELPMLSK